MRDYGAMSPQFWLGATGRRLRGDKDAQLVATYLVTSPHANMIGVYHLPIVYIAHETGLTLEEASKGLRRLIEEHFCCYDEALELVFIYRMAAYQIADHLQPNDKRVKGIRRELEQIPQSIVRTRFIELYADAFHLVDMLPPPVPSQAPSQAPCEAPSEPLRSQEQEHDMTGTGQEHEQDARAGDGPTMVSRGTPNAYREHWLAIVARYPRGPTRGNWVMAEKLACQLVAAGKTTWPELEAQVGAYSAYCRATTRLVAPPERFFAEDGTDRWAGDWTVPKRERQATGGLSASAKHWGEDDPGVACAGR